MADSTFIAATRAAFEKWITSPPYDRILSRYGKESVWPGHYAVYEVELAWQAWLQATRQEATRREVQHT